MYNKDTMQYVGYIYSVYCSETNKYYIGQTKRDIYTRWTDHVNASKKKNDTLIFHLAIRHYGEEAFHIRIVETVSEKNYKTFKEKLNAAERKQIKLYDCIYPNGYNISKGCGGSGKYLKNDCKPCDLYDLNGNYIRSFGSIKEASEICGLSDCAIGDCCRGKHCRTRAGVFRFKGDSFDKYRTIDNANFRGEVQVDKYSIDGNFIKSYNTIKEAAEDNNLTTGKAQYYVEQCSLIDSSYVFIRSSDFFDINKVKPLGVKVDEVDCNGNILHMFDSMSEASKYTGISSTSITDCCSGKYTHAKHRYFVYHDKKLINELKKCVSN